MELKDKVSESTKWTFVTEISAKIVTPVSNMILARLLSPDAFGVLATIQMVLSFADMFADAGFQKYVVQKEYKTEDEKNKSILVAVYTNIALGFFIWGLISFFSEEIAELVGNPGLGLVLIVSGLNIPLVSFSSVQLAVLRREFLFKQLLIFRLITVIIPLFVTIPLAICGYGYWALIIGILVAQFLQSLIVLFKGKVKLKIYYSFSHLKVMLTFSAWTVLESVFIWLTAWCDVFIVTQFFDTYYLGLYKMSMTCVNSLLAIISSATLPVLYSALSRLQNDKEKYIEMFYYINKRTAMFVLPIGFGLYCYKDLARVVLFGDKWHQADMMIGLWGLSSCLMIIYGHFCSEVYRSLGKPKISTLVQLLHLICLVPSMYLFSSNFEDLVWTRNIIRLQFIFSHFIMMYFIIKINSLKMLCNTWKYVVSSLIMTATVLISRHIFNNVVYDWCSMILAVIIYFSILLLFGEERNILKQILKDKRLI